MALQSGQSSLFSDRSSRCEFDHQLQSMARSREGGLINNGIQIACQPHLALAAGLVLWFY
jgi:hypothetical protein